MNHDHIAELLGAYALDALEEDEKHLVDAHLPTCGRCRGEVEDHRHVASLLAHSGGTAPDGIWERIQGSLDEPPSALRLVPAEPVAPAPPGGQRPAAVRWRISRAAVAVAAAAAAVMAVLGIQVRQQDQRIDELQTALRDPLAPAFQAALQDPASQVIELRSADGGTALRGAVTSDGTGYLRAAPLSDLAEGRTYQLWGAAGDQLVSLGVLGRSPDIVTFAADPYDAFAITEEATPGVVVTDNDPVVAGGTV